jgi:hypothetical protein
VCFATDVPTIGINVAGSDPMRMTVCVSPLSSPSQDSVGIFASRIHLVRVPGMNHCIALTNDNRRAQYPITSAGIVDETNAEISSGTLS